MPDGVLLCQLSVIQEVPHLTLQVPPCFSGFLGLRAARLPLVQAPACRQARPSVAMKYHYHAPSSALAPVKFATPPKHQQQKCQPLQQARSAPAHFKDATVDMNSRHGSSKLCSTSSIESGSVLFSIPDSHVLNAETVAASAIGDAVKGAQSRPFNCQLARKRNNSSQVVLASESFAQAVSSVQEPAMCCNPPAPLASSCHKNMPEQVVHPRKSALHCR